MDARALRQAAAVPRFRPHPLRRRAHSPSRRLARRPRAPAAPQRRATGRVSRFQQGALPAGDHRVPRFPRRFPDSALADSAQYWIGEAYQHMRHRRPADKARGTRAGGAGVPGVMVAYPRGARCRPPSTRKLALVELKQTALPRRACNAWWSTSRDRKRPRCEGSWPAKGGASAGRSTLSIGRVGAVAIVDRLGTPSCQLGRRSHVLLCRGRIAATPAVAGKHEPAAGASHKAPGRADAPHRLEIHHASRTRAGRSAAMRWRTAGQKAAQSGSATDTSALCTRARRRRRRSTSVRQSPQREA
jgi:hypothetical protein